MLTAARTIGNETGVIGILWDIDGMVALSEGVPQMLVFFESVCKGHHHGVENHYRQQISLIDAQLEWDCFGGPQSGRDGSAQV